MSVTRKEFLKSSSLLLGGMFLSKNSLINMLQDNLKGFKTIRDNIGIYSERGGTILWYAANDCAAIVDSQFPDQAKNMLSGLKQKTGAKIKYLFNTHHHGDHTAGNIYLKDFVEDIAANVNCARLQHLKNGQGDNAKNQAYPTVTFGDHDVFDLGKETVHAYHFAPAHTGGDSIYHFVNSNVVHMGDLVFNRLYPYFGLSDEGSLKGWISFLDRVMTNFTDSTTFVFGHSLDPDKVIGNWDDLVVMKRYISSLLEFVEKEIKKGKTKEEISAAAAVPGFESMKENRKGALKGNIEQAFDELSRKD